MIFCWSGPMAGGKDWTALLTAMVAERSGRELADDVADGQAAG